MNSSDIVDAVVEEVGLTQGTADVAVSDVLDCAPPKLNSPAKISFFGFGTLVSTKRSARTGRNPQTGEPVKIAAPRGVRFVPVSAFEQMLNGQKAAQSASKRSAASKSGPTKKSASARRLVSKTKSAAKKAPASRKR